MKTSSHNFKTNLSVISNSNPYVVNFNYIYINKGCALCTNGYIFIRQDLRLHGLYEEDIINLEGKYIHKNIFKRFFKADIVRFREDFIEEINEHSSIKYSYSKLDKWLNYDSLLEQKQLNPVNMIGLNSSYLNKISQVICIDGIKNELKLEFTNETSQIFVTEANNICEYVNMAFLMPIHLLEV